MRKNYNGLEPSLSSGGYGPPYKTGHGSVSGGGSWGNSRGGSSGFSGSSDNQRGNYIATSASGGVPDCTEEHPCEEPEHHGPEHELPDACLPADPITLRDRCETPTNSPEVKFQSSAGQSTGSRHKVNSKKRQHHRIQQAQTFVPVQHESNDDYSWLVALGVVASFVLLGGSGYVMKKSS